MSEQVKIFFMGIENTGKTSFIQRVAYDSFNSIYIPTTGIDIVSLSLEVDETKFDVKLMDIAGNCSLKFIRMMSGAHSIVFTFSFDDLNSLKELSILIPQLGNFITAKYELILLGTKYDLRRKEEENQFNELIMQLIYSFSLEYYTSSAQEDSLDSLLKIIKNIIQEVSIKRIRNITVSSSISLHEKIKFKKKTCC